MITVSPETHVCSSPRSTPAPTRSASAVTPHQSFSAKAATVFALAAVVIKELYRRKDFYVLFFMTAAITLLMASVNFFNDDKIVRFVKDIALLLVWICTLVIAIGTTARQIPAERESRTIFPLLAKPVSRAQVVLGKFAGCWLASGICLLVFYLFLFVLSGSKENQWPVASYFQTMWLQWMMLSIVVGLVLLGSLVFSAPSANATICFIFIVGIVLIGRHLNTVALRATEPLQTLIYSIYFLIPHLEWYDVRDLLVYQQPVVPWIDCALATLYAGTYAALLLVASWVLFRRKTLTI